jgi:Anticodon-binding domain
VPWTAKPLSVGDVKAREQAALQRAGKESRRTGVNVSVEAQKIYDVFSKTYYPRQRR